jgi:hypothetical protein
MRVSLGALTLALATLAGATALEAQQLREDSYRWYVAPQGGVLLFETQTQTSSAIPTAGLQAMIIGKRGGLMVSFEEAFGSEETSAFGDATAPNGVREVTFDRIRKYSAIMMAYPLRSRLEPYLGVGFGILHTVGTEVTGFFTDPEEAASVSEEAVDRGSTGFGSFVGGLQYRISPKVVFYGQYQVTTAPASGKLLIGPTHTFVAGLRLGLGSAKEGVRGGGY